MQVDHIFICTGESGKVADALVSFGLLEGSSRVHKGQGTRNRKFYFDNFFLEILWVHDESEIKSEATNVMGLWQRTEHAQTGFSPFGLCLVNTDETEALFAKALKHQTDYFPKGMLIDIIKNDQQGDLPWTFRLPFKGQKKYENEPTLHKNGISTLTKVIFEHSAASNDGFLNHFTNDSSIHFIQSSKNWLTLVFDHERQAQKRTFDELQMSIQY